MEGPYREGRPLPELIAPDRRRQRTLALVAGGMVAGALLLHLGRWLLEERRDEPRALPVPVVRPTVERAEGRPVVTPGPLTADEVQRVVAAHRLAVKATCWDREKGPASTRTTLRLVVGANGEVVSATTHGGDALVASCVEAQARRWEFPAHGERSSSFEIPFVFTRE